MDQRHVENGKFRAIMFFFFFNGYVYVFVLL